MVAVLDFGKRRIGKSCLPQDQIAKRNEFDKSARNLACIVRRAEVDTTCVDSENILICFRTKAEADEFLYLMAKVQRRRRVKIKK
jgi:hypothetical protein